ncbi:hypothetical protein PG994_006924 [Apiospora phragmitis]|uniref:Uncharacterized protein n=1 Tax=Apiospora phragmitis TaxID=2905665 RepID=A0ABR1VK95_9PEZI
MNAVFSAVFGIKLLAVSKVTRASHTEISHVHCLPLGVSYYGESEHEGSPRRGRVASRYDQSPCLLFWCSAVAVTVAALQVDSLVSQPPKHKPDHYDLLKDVLGHFTWAFPTTEPVARWSTADGATVGPPQARPCRGYHRHNHDRVRRFHPEENRTDCISVVAIHGLDTESPRTWIYEKNGTQVHWLRDSDMLPAAIPEARIYTYDWNAKVFDHAPVQTLLGHADNLLGQVAAERGQGNEARPLIFVASCFGGLVLAEAICRAAQEGSPYREVLLATVGAVFLATPFAGTDAAQPASWLVTIKGIMGEDASDNLIQDLQRHHNQFIERVQRFAEIALSIMLPVRCFFETKKTDIYRRILPPSLARLRRGSKGLILVAQSSACIHGHYRQGLEKQHVMMNKFEGPDDSQFKLVRYQIQQLASGAKEALRCRRNG